jgi:hypothetical protein
VSGETTTFAPERVAWDGEAFADFQSSHEQNLLRLDVI